LVVDPSYAAFNSQGELFVANRRWQQQGWGVGSIARFTFDAAGDPIANGEITGNSLDTVMGLAFSPTGELFAVNHFNGTISRFLFDPAGNAVPNGTIPTGGNQGLAFSPNGELFVAHYSSVERFLFDPVTKAAIPNGSFSIPGAGYLHGLTFSAQGELFAADPGSDLVFRLVFDGLGNPVDNGTISVAGAPLGVALSSAGELFVTSHYTGGISRFLFDVNGDAMPNGFTPTDHLGGVAIFAGTTSPTPTPTPTPPTPTPPTPTPMPPTPMPPTPTPTSTPTPTPPPAVGGVVELQRGPSAPTARQPDPPTLPYVALAGAAAAAFAVLGGAWYARRRRAR
jgi:WD40 repeat protein